MAEKQKRQFPDKEETADEAGSAEFSGHGPDPKRRKLSLPISVITKVMRELRCADFLSEFESLCRKVVIEEVNKSDFGRKSSRSLNDNQEESAAAAATPETPSLELHFINNTPRTIFTTSKIQADDGRPLQVVLCDASSKAPVRSSPLSSAQIEVVVVDGEFGSRTGGRSQREGSCWTVCEFNRSIVRPREGKRPLIVGQGLSFSLQDGEGFISNLSFTDNSSWVKCRKFRLGARIKDGQKISGQFPRIIEAISDPFFVKDHRLEVNEKRHPPSMGDEVWRLDGIRKDGAYHRRLSSQNITTVFQFLKLFQANPSSLRVILGDRVPEKAWKVMVNHAMECLTDDATFIAANNGCWVEDYKKCEAFDNEKYLEAKRLSSNSFAPNQSSSILQVNPLFDGPNICPRAFHSPVIHQDQFLCQNYGVGNASRQDFLTVSEETLQPSATSFSHDDGGTSWLSNPSDSLGQFSAEFSDFRDFFSAMDGRSEL